MGEDDVLCCLQEIELSEALCGLKRIIRTLDDRQLVISTHAGDVIKHGTPLLPSLSVFFYVYAITRNYQGVKYTNFFVFGDTAELLTLLHLCMYMVYESL